MAGEAKAKRARQREAPATPVVPDGFDLRKDGTVLAHVAGERYLWRRPKIGELRKLREAVAERDAKLNEARDRIAARDSGAEDASAVAVAAMGETVLAVADVQGELNVEWVEFAWRMLGDKEPPPIDEWPSGSDQTGMITGLLKHWREVPLRSGAS